MIKYLIIIPSLILLFVIGMQDLRTKMISAFLFPALFVVLLSESIFLNGFRFSILNFSLNVIFLSVVLLCLTIFFAFRGNKKFIGHFTNWGDILMFICLCAAFSFINFYLFFCISSMLIVTGILFSNLLKSEKIKNVPQAGLLALGLGLVKIAGLFFISPFIDWINLS